jgi:hypothetical protein
VLIPSMILTFVLQSLLADFSALSSI